MKVTQQIATEALRTISGNQTYTSYHDQWRYLLESYMGGPEYKSAGHLVKYQTETAAEYNIRLATTPLDNHCQSVVSVYTSFLFKDGAYRDLGSLGEDSMMRDFMRDCDHEGRTLDHFMQDLSVWVSVFGHAWIIVSKPDVGAQTAAEEQAAGVRPYLSMLTPLYVLDWQYERDQSGRYSLEYLKYIEEVNGDVVTVKEWTRDTIKTSIVDKETDVFVEQPVVEPNGLKEIPAVVCYNKRSSYRGIGISDIADIADLQKFIYNATSEVDQSIRLNTHPSLVKTNSTLAGIGAGSIIQMDESMDPGLKPYLLEFNGASIESIYRSIEEATAAIDRIANTGAVRAKETKVMSGVSREVEFQMLNSRLAQKAHSIELAEEQMWKLISAYMGYTWEGSIAYPMSFNVRDSHNDLEFYQKALMSGVPSKEFKDDIYRQIADLTASEQSVFDTIKAEIQRAPTGNFDMSAMVEQEFIPHMMANPESGEQRMANTLAEHLELQARGWQHI